MRTVAGAFGRVKRDGGIFFDQFPNLPFRHASALQRQEQRVAVLVAGNADQIALIVDIIVQHRGCRLIQRHHRLLAALTVNDKFSAVKIERRYIQLLQLRKPQPIGQKQD